MKSQCSISLLLALSCVVVMTRSTAKRVHSRSSVEKPRKHSTSFKRAAASRTNATPSKQRASQCSPVRVPYSPGAYTSARSWSTSKNTTVKSKPLRRSAKWQPVSSPSLPASPRVAQQASTSGSRERKMKRRGSRATAESALARSRLSPDCVPKRIRLTRVCGDSGVIANSTDNPC